MLIRNVHNDRALSQSIDNDTPANVSGIKPPAQKTARKSKKLQQQPSATTLVRSLESTTSEIENNADTMSANTTSTPKVEKKAPPQARSGVGQRNSPKVCLCLRLGVMLFYLQLSKAAPTLEAIKQLSQVKKKFTGKTGRPSSVKRQSSRATCAMISG